MPTKTITIEEDVYEMLESLKQGGRDSFSQVIRREIKPPKRGITGAELLALIQRPGGLLGMSPEETERWATEVEAVRREGREAPQRDPWAG